MGANLSRRLMRDGHRVVVSDVNEAVSQLEGEGAVGSRRWPIRRQAGQPAWRG